MLSSQGLFISPFIPLAIFAINFAFLSAGKFFWAERIGKKRALELAMVQAVTLETLAMVIETRHTETGGHVKRTQHYVKHLAQWLKKNKKYRPLLSDETIELLFRSSPLHDVGKVGVPDAILKNPGKLTPDEFETMKYHTVYGKEIFDEAEAKLGHNSFLSIARTIAYTHHEKWDGSGYPRGLKGEAIPLYGRIMAIADIYDALISQRSYKAAMSHEAAADYIGKISGTELDPTIVDAFINCQAQFKEVANRYTDDSERELALVNH
jgi:response regulator RpfG family c-di-GMP phosphodiesterase